MDIKEFIILKEGFFDSKSYAKFLKFVKNDLQYFDQGIINNRDKGDIKIDSNLRKVKGAHLNNNWAIAPNKDDTFAMTKLLWYNFLVRQFSYLLNEFFSRNDSPIKHHDYDMDIQVLKYEDDGHYLTHTDYAKTAPRQFSFSYILNDDYNGGDFEFHLLNKEILKVKPKANSCLLFPSNFMFPHKVNPVTSGTRYVVVGWMP